MTGIVRLGYNLSRAKRRFKNKSNKPRTITKAHSKVMVKTNPTGFVNRVKSIVQKEFPNLHKVITESVQAGLHNNVYSINLLGNIGQGTSNFTRTGDEIHILSMKFQWTVSNQAIAVINAGSGKSQIPTVKYRLLVIKDQSDYQSGSDAWARNNFGYGGSNTTIAINQGVANNTVVDAPGSLLIDSKVCTVVYNKLFTLKTFNYYDSTGSNNVWATNENYGYEYLKLNTKFIYQTDNNDNYAKKYNYYLLFMPYVTGGTYNTTAAANITMNADIIFKNCA